MKAHLTKVSLALLSTVFLLGCQDMGSEPVGPDGLVPQFNKPDANGKHNHGDDGGSGSGQGTVKLELRMGATSFPVSVKERDKNLKFNNIDLMHAIKMDFKNADGDPYGRDDCVGPDDLSDPEWDYLLDELTTSKVRTAIFISIDKSGLEVGGDPTTSDDAGHLLLVERDLTFGDLPGTTGIKVGRNAHSNELTVKWISSNLSTDVFEFTGPGVSVQASDPLGRGGKFGRGIVCTFVGLADLANKVKLTLHR